MDSFALSKCKIAKICAADSQLEFEKSPAVFVNFFSVEIFTIFPGKFLTNYLMVGN